MRFYVVRKDNDKFSIFAEELSLSSARYQYIKKNFQIFDTMEGAQNYVLENVSPEVKEQMLNEMKLNNLERMKEKYKEINEKSDMERLFGCMLSDYGYENIKSFIDYLMRGE